MWQLSEARNRTAETTSDRRLFGWSEGLCPLAAASPPSIRKSAPFIASRVERAKQLLQTGSDFSQAEVAAYAGCSA